MKPTASLICALIVPAMAMLPLLAQAQPSSQEPAEARPKPVLASTYVAAPATATATPSAVPAPAPAEPDAGAPTPAARRAGSLPQDGAPEPGEPDVKYIVIEADGTRIEELRVRGVSQRLTVQTRLGPREGYEIIMGDGSRDLSPGANTSRGATGQRVWHVLSF